MVSSASHFNGINILFIEVENNIILFYFYTEGGEKNTGSVLVLSHPIAAVRHPLNFEHH